MIGAQDHQKHEGARMDEVRVDSDLINGIAKSLRAAARHMKPTYDRPGTEDDGGGNRRDTLAGAKTGRGNYGDFAQGRALRSAYLQAHEGTLDVVASQARKLRRYAEGLEKCVTDMEEGEELRAVHFRAIGKIIDTADPR